MQRPFHGERNPHFPCYEAVFASADRRLPDPLAMGKDGRKSTLAGGIVSVTSILIFISGATLLIYSAERLIGALVGISRELAISVFHCPSGV